MSGSAAAAILVPRTMISFEFINVLLLRWLTLVPQPNKNPTPSVVIAEAKEFGGAG